MGLDQCYDQSDDIYILLDGMKNIRLSHFKDVTLPVVDGSLRDASFFLKLPLAFPSQIQLHNNGPVRLVQHFEAPSQLCDHHVSDDRILHGLHQSGDYLFHRDAVLNAAFE